MSYILDALKKAESDRKLGSLPNIHTQTIPVIESDGGASFGVKRWVLAVLTVLMLLALGLAVIAWLRPAQIAPAPAPVAATAAQPPLSLPQAAGPAPLVSATDTPAPPAPPAAASNKSTEAAPPPQPAATPKTVQPRVKPPAPKPETPAPAEIRVATLRELPQNIQAEIPTLAVNGYIYSKNPAERSMLINNKLLHEGEQIAPGLTLEKMMPKEAILDYRGYRYRLSY